MDSFRQFYNKDNNRITDTVKQIQKFDKNQRLLMLNNKILGIKKDLFKADVSKNKEANFETMSFSIDKSQRKRFDILTEELGVSKSLCLRYLINDLIDKHMDIIS